MQRLGSQRSALDFLADVDGLHASGLRLDMCALLYEAGPGIGDAIVRQIRSGGPGAIRAVNAAIADLDDEYDWLGEWGGRRG